MGGAGCKTCVPDLEPWCGPWDRDLHHGCGARVRGLGTVWARVVLAGGAAPGLVTVLANHL